MLNSNIVKQELRKYLEEDGISETEIEPTCTRYHKGKCTLALLEVSADFPTGVVISLYYWNGYKKVQVLVQHQNSAIDLLQEHFNAQVGRAH